jgi:hypothetical protein
MVKRQFYGLAREDGMAGAMSRPPLMVIAPGSAMSRPPLTVIRAGGHA